MPTTIKFAEKSASGELLFTNLSPEELIKKTGQNFTWTESLSFDVKDAGKFPPLAKNTIVVNKEVFVGLNELIKKSEDKLAISFINDSIGYGLIAAEDIPKKTLISCYVGHYSLVSDAKKLSSHGNPYAIGIEGLNGQIVGSIDAQTKRNRAAFLQHLPKEKAYQLDCSIDPKAVAWANLSPTVFSYLGIPVIIYYTNRPIAKGEVLGFDYGLNHFLSLDIIPKLCYKDGSLIPTYKYKAIDFMLQVHYGQSVLQIDEEALTRTAYEGSLRLGATILPLPDNSGTKILITKEDYLKATEKYPPHSPFVILSTPSSVIRKEDVQQQSSVFQSGLTQFKPPATQGDGTPAEQDIDRFAASSSL